LRLNYNVLNNIDAGIENSNNVKFRNIQYPEVQGNHAYFSNF